MIPLIHTVSQRRRVHEDGTVEHYPKVVIEVPATELTWLANCERIAEELRHDDRCMAASHVDATCRRMLGVKE